MFNIQESQSYRNIGNVNLIMGEYEDAIKNFDKAIEFNNQDADAYRNRGIAKYNLGKYEYSIKDFDRAIVLNPYDDKSLLAKEESLERLKEKEKKR